MSATRSPPWTPAATRPFASGDDLVVELLRGDRIPRAVDLAAVDDLLRTPGGVVEHDAGEVLVLLGRHLQRSAVLADGVTASPCTRFPLVVAERLLAARSLVEGDAPWRAE